MILTELKYNVLAEISSGLMALLLCYNILSSSFLNDKRHRLFLWAALSTLFCTALDILASYCITFPGTYSHGFCTAVSTFFYILLLAVPFLLADYAYDIATAYKNNPGWGFRLCGIIYLIYISMMLINIKTGFVFYYDENGIYTHGPLKYITYFTMLIFCTFTVIIVAFNRRAMAGRIFAIFLIYPFLAVVTMLIQFLYPNCIMTGTAMFSALFLAYITIQADLLEFDIATGLMTEHKLRKHVEVKSQNGILMILSIDNISQMLNTMTVNDMNHYILALSKYITSYNGRKTYHVSTGRFALITENEDYAKFIAEEINNYIEDVNDTPQMSVHVDTTCAAIKLQRGEKSYDAIMEIINSLLNKARLANSHSLHFCDDTVLKDMERKGVIYKILKRELNVDSKVFQVFYQPIYSVKEDRFVYMEALSRLIKTPELGDVSPGEFVSVAEQRGLIEQLGNTAFEKVCKFISENRSTVNAVSINFSVLQMMNPAIVKRVQSTIEKFQIKPENIIIEITESIFIDDFEIVSENIRQLHEFGVQFYLDDFGTGYSNFANVVALPFSTVKIDRTIVLQMEENATNEKLFTNIIGTFKDSGLKVLVEGVETKRQNEMVIESGTDFIQGFLYSKPISETACLQLFKNGGKK